MILTHLVNAERFGEAAHAPQLDIDDARGIQRDSLLGVVRMLLGWAAPAAQWIEAERGGCAYVAAVALDRRIAYNRMLMAQQSGH